jgi:hypothetical protein
MILATPVVGAALLMLGGLLIWSATTPSIAPGPSVVAAMSPTPTPPANERTVIAIASATPAAGQTAASVPAAEPTPTAAPPSATPLPEPTRTPTPAPARSARVVNTDGQGANMRRAPSVSAQRVKLLVEGTIVELVGGEQRGDGYAWRNVRDVDGGVGFVIADYLDPIEAPPGATPVLPPPPIRVEEITSPAARGGEATLMIITRPGVRCELRVLLFGPATLPREGLESKMADADGACSWTWKVPEDVVPGMWRYRISAGEGESRSVREVPFVVT